MPSTPRLPSGFLQAAEDRLGLLVRALDVGADVLIRADDLDARVRRDRLEESLLALARAVVTFGVAQQDDLALAAERLRDRARPPCGRP